MADWTRLASASAVTALLLSTPALADFHEDWDADADGALTDDEFGAGITEYGVFERWDGDADGFLAEEEFGASLGEADNFEEWDTDGDGMLSEDEFGEGLFGRYDEDVSGVLEDDELVGAPEEPGGWSIGEADAVSTGSGALDLANEPVDVGNEPVEGVDYGE